MPIMNLVGRRMYSNDVLSRVSPGREQWRERTIAHLARAEWPGRSLCESSVSDKSEPPFQCQCRV